MGQVVRHLETVAYKDATVKEADFYEHLEHGTITGVTATGRYKTFTTAFSAEPQVVITGEGANARLAHAPAAGSFKVELDAGGTVDAGYIAWGAR